MSPAAPLPEAARDTGAVHLHRDHPAVLRQATAEAVHRPATRHQASAAAVAAATAEAAREEDSAGAVQEAVSAVVAAAEAEAQAVTEDNIFIKAYI